jgi:hypothetical protein
VQPPWKAIWRSLKKLIIELSYNPVMPFLDIHLKECTPGYDKATFINKFIAAVFTIDKLWEQLRCLSTDDGLGKCVYEHNEVLFSHKEE